MGRSDSVRLSKEQRILVCAGLLQVAQGCLNNSTHIEEAAKTYTIWQAWKLCRAMFLRPKGRRDFWEGRNNDSNKMIAEMRDWLKTACTESKLSPDLLSELIQSA